MRAVQHPWQIWCVRGRWLLILSTCRDPGTAERAAIPSACATGSDLPLGLPEPAGGRLAQQSGFLTCFAHGPRSEGRSCPSLVEKPDFLPASRLA